MTFILDWPDQPGLAPFHFEVTDAMPIPRIGERFNFTTPPRVQGWHVVQGFRVLAVDHYWPGPMMVKLTVESATKS